MKITTVTIEKPDDVNIILGMSHFIKTVEDIHEALVTTVPGIAYGLAFCEASGECLVRSEGTDEALETMAIKNALAIGAGHSFIITLGNAFPINVLRVLQTVPEIVGFHCATANPVDVIVADNGNGRGILGVIDGRKPQGVEDEEGRKWRHGFLRTIGYKK